MRSEQSKKKITPKTGAKKSKVKDLDLKREGPKGGKHPAKVTVPDIKLGIG